jgi:hypothetical protein
MHEIRRKLYKRGSSYETTIPMPMLFTFDLNKKHDVVFSFDPKKNIWFVRIEGTKKEVKHEKKTKRDS